MALIAWNAFIYLSPDVMVRHCSSQVSYLTLFDQNECSIPAYTPVWLWPGSGLSALPGRLASRLKSALLLLRTLATWMSSRVRLERLYEPPIVYMVALPAPLFALTWYTAAINCAAGVACHVTP